MVSLTVLRDSLYDLAKLAKNDSVTLKFHANGQVFIFTLEPTFEFYNSHKHAQRRKKFNKNKRGPVPLEGTACPTCRYAVIAGICINKKCDTNLQPKPNS